MGISRRVATAVQMGCSAATLLVIDVALGPARAVGVMSLMYPLLPISAAADPSPGLTRRPARRPARVGHLVRAVGLVGFAHMSSHPAPADKDGARDKQRAGQATRPQRRRRGPSPARSRANGERSPAQEPHCQEEPRPHARPLHGRVHAGQVEGRGHDAEIKAVPGECGVRRRAKGFARGTD